MNRFPLRLLVMLAVLIAGIGYFYAQPAGPAANVLENGLVAVRLEGKGGVPRPATFEDERSGEKLPLPPLLFRIELGDGKTIRSGDCKVVGAPRIEALAPEPEALVASRHDAGKCLKVSFLSPDGSLALDWRLILRDGSSYAREELTVSATRGDVLVKDVVLFEEKVWGAGVVGIVSGSPVTAGNFFLGYESPLAKNEVAADGTVRCSLARNALLRSGEKLVQGCVIGAAPAGQMRRGFQAYIERERAHPYRPFLHYNSWWDISWSDRKYNEAQALDVIDRYGQELVRARGVQMDSFLFDDGWDDERTLWQFHSGFPHGFTAVGQEAAKFGAGIGVWISPFGGYMEAKQHRLEYGRAQGFETNERGFSLSGPRYYQRFHDITTEMISKYKVNLFKFDGLHAEGGADDGGAMRDGDAMIRLIGDLRAAEPGVYISQTIGTWPSPFWLFLVDSTWRGDADYDFLGKGTDCQQWMNFRDARTYANVVRNGPLYPLNSIMLHGVICAVNADRLKTMSDADFAEQVRTFFGSGTQIQELYMTPASLTPHRWDLVAEAAKWSRANSDVLVDTHWIGGDPNRKEVYGWASWSPRKAIVTLRNPSDQPAEFRLDPQAAFELPPGAAQSYRLHSPWQEERDRPAVEAAVGRPATIRLKPFEAVVLESE